MRTSTQGGYHNASIGPLFEIIAERKQQFVARAEEFKSISCLFHQPVSDGTGLLQPVEPGICSLPLVTILTVSCVQDVINNLERQADSFTICFDAGEIRFRSFAKIRPNPNCNTDQSGRL